MTEKNYNPEQRNVKTIKKQKKIEAKKADLSVAKKEEKITQTEIKKEETKPVEIKKFPEVKKLAVKKEFAETNIKSASISTLDAIYICRFIKNKSIEKAISDLEEVVKLKKAVPMKGEIPHRKGKGMMSGRFPVNSSKEFILILKGLMGNSNVNGLENPVISEAIANQASKPYGRFGRVQRKRTHVRLVARNKKEEKK